MEKKLMNKTFTNIEILNIVAWYNKMRNNDETKHKFECLPFKIQYALRSNIKAMADTIKPFEEMINDYKKQLQEEFFTEDKTNKIHTDKGDELKLKDEYLEEYTRRGHELEEKLNEVSFENTDVTLSCYDLDEILDALSEEAIEKYGMTVDDFSMLEFMNVG